MELSAFSIYCIGIVDGVKSMLAGLGTMFAFLSAMFAVVEMTDFPERPERVKNAMRRLLITFVVLFAICTLRVFIPTSKTVIAMMTIPPIINNEEVQKLPKNLIEFLNDYLESFKPRSEKGEV